MVLFMNLIGTYLAIILDNFFSTILFCIDTTKQIIIDNSGEFQTDLFFSTFKNKETVVVSELNNFVCSLFVNVYAILAL